MFTMWLWNSIAFNVSFIKMVIEWTFSWSVSSFNSNSNSTISFENHSNPCCHIQIVCGAGEMAQWLRVFHVLLESSHSALSIHRVAYSCLELQKQGSPCSLLASSGTLTCVVQTYKYTHKLSKTIFENSGN